MPRRRRKKKQHVNWGVLAVFGTVFSLLGGAATTIAGGYSLWNSVAQKEWVSSELGKLEKDIDGRISVAESNARAYSNNNRAEFTREADLKFAEIRQNIAVMQERMSRLFEIVGRNKDWIDTQKHQKGR